MPTAVNMLNRTSMITTLLLGYLLKKLINWIQSLLWHCFGVHLEKSR